MNCFSGIKNDYFKYIIFTNPYVEWNDDLPSMTHSKTINIMGDIVANYDRGKGEEIKNIIDWA